VIAAGEGALDFCWKVPGNGLGNHDADGYGNPGGLQRVAVWIRAFIGPDAGRVGPDASRR
jgi:hypothetical protein